MKKPSRTVPRRRQSVSPTPRHLPVVDILIDTQAELQELVVASGLKGLEAMLEEDRAAVCGPRYAHQPARQAYRTGHTPSQVVLGGRKVAMRRPPCAARRRGGSVANGPGIRECGPAEPARGRPDADRCGDPPVCAESGTARRRRHQRGARASVRSVDAVSRRLRRSWMRGGRRRSTRWTWWGC